MTRHLTHWRLFAVVLLALVAIGCGGTEEPADAPDAAPAAEPEPAAPMGLDREILADPTRPADEVAQDADRKALDAYEFLGVEAGMTVADVWTSAGYNTHLLSRAVGDAGKVYGILGFYATGDFATADAMAQRITDASLTNVELVSAITDVPADSVDVSVAVRNFHDADEYGDGRPATVAQLLAMTKPGGVVGIIDVATHHEGWHADTHRLNEQAVIDDFTGGGFEFVESSDILRNADDDHSTAAFDTGRHKADRYLLKFRKPVN